MTLIIILHLVGERIAQRLRSPRHQEDCEGGPRIMEAAKSCLAASMQVVDRESKNFCRELFSYSRLQLSIFEAWKLLL